MTRTQSSKYGYTYGDRKGQPANAFGIATYRRLYEDFLRRRTKEKLSITRYAEAINKEYTTNGVTLLGRIKPPGRTSIVTHLSEIDRQQDTPVAKKDTVTYACGHSVDKACVHALVNKWGYSLPIDKPCITCQTREEQTQKKEDAGRYVLHRLTATSSNVKVCWPDGNIVSVDVGRHLQNQLSLPSWIRHDLGFARYCLAEPVSIRWLDYDTLNPHVGVMSYEEGAKYNGADHPDSYEFDSDNVLTTPQDVDFGICYWEVTPKSTKKGRRKRGKHNFVVFGKLGASFEDVVAVAKKDTVQMTNMETITRKGTAGKFHIPTQSRLFDTKSCSTATKETRVFARGSTTNTSIVYLNHTTGRVVRYPQVSADLYATDMSPTAKRNMLQKEAVERRMSLKEMKSRVAAVAIVHELQLDVGGGSGFEGIQMAIDRASNKNVRDEWLACDKILSMWDIVLLEHDCMSGESRNHQPVGYHTDGNELDWCETYTTFPKVGPAETSLGGTSSQIVQHCTPADLPLVHQGFAARSRPGIDIFHLCLDNTYHAAGKERGRKNYSKVKGSYAPKKKK